MPNRVKLTYKNNKVQDFFVDMFQRFIATSLANNMAKIIVIFIAIISQSCAPFSSLPKTMKESRNIKGIYLNDCRTDSAQRSRTLWSLVDYKSEVKRDGLTVKFEIIEDEMLKAYLMTRDSVLVEKIIKGKFNEDGCFYSRRQFYIIPILPILFLYSNYQKRIYSIEGSLVFEVTYNQGGAVIIMAGGDKFNYIYEFEKLR